MRTSWSSYEIWDVRAQLYTTAVVAQTEGWLAVGLRGNNNLILFRAQFGTRHALKYITGARLNGGASFLPCSYRNHLVNSWKTSLALHEGEF